jgi:hypothetical protein
MTTVRARVNFSGPKNIFNIILGNFENNNLPKSNFAMKLVRWP